MRTDSCVVLGYSVVCSDWLLRRVAAGIRYFAAIKIIRDALKQGSIKQLRGSSKACMQPYGVLLSVRV
jgi:hypothetical protein